MISWPLAFLIVVLSLIGLYALRMTYQVLIIRKLLKEIKENDEGFYVWSDDE